MQARKQSQSFLSLKKNLILAHFLNQPDWLFMIFSLQIQVRCRLILNDVKASCGCTTPEWTKEPVLPGKSGSIRVTFNPKNRPGSFSKTIQVNSNADLPVVTLVIKGVVIPAEKIEDVYRFSVGPVRIQTIYAAFGEIYKGSTGKFSIKVMNTSHDTTVQLSFKQLPPYISVKMVPASLGPQQEGRIDMEYASSLQNNWDYVVDRVDLLLNGKAAPNNRISITANIKENFGALTAEEMALAPVVQFDETTFDFGTTSPDKVIEHVFILTNAGKSNLVYPESGRQLWLYCSSACQNHHCTRRIHTDKNGVQSGRP